MSAQTPGPWQDRAWKPGLPREPLELCQGLVSHPSRAAFPAGPCTLGRLPSSRPKKTSCPWRQRLLSRVRQEAGRQELRAPQTARRGPQWQVMAKLGTAGPQGPGDTRFLNPSTEHLLPAGTRVDQRRSATVGHRPRQHGVPLAAPSPSSIHPGASRALPPACVADPAPWALRSSETPVWGVGRLRAWALGQVVGMGAGRPGPHTTEEAASESQQNPHSGGGAWVPLIRPEALRSLNTWVAQT